MEKIKMLIVDDEVNIAKTIAATFAHWDYHVEICNDGVCAWDKLQNEHFDITLLDLRLPGIDGMEVMKRLWEAKLNVDVIMITAHGNVDNAVQAMKYGAQDFVQKPLDPDKLRELVNKVLERRQLRMQNNIRYNEMLEEAKKHIRNREYSKAKTIIEAAVKLIPNEPDGFNFLGAVCEIMGDNVAAMKAYQTAVKNDGDYQPAVEHLRRISSFGNRNGIILDMNAPK